MKKVAVVYWSGTGNTEAMATAVAEGAKAAGAEVTVMTSATFTPDKVDEFDSIAFGCPSMGDEVLEETEFDPMFTECESKLSGKPIALFGSYGWGDGEWMRDWQARMAHAGADVVGGEGVIAQESPDEDALNQCRKLGKALAAAEA